MPTFPKPRYVDANRIPLNLHIKVSATNPRLFDLVDDAGCFLAREVPDMNTARLLARAPLLLDRFYEMRWMLVKCLDDHLRDSDDRKACSKEEIALNEWLDDLSVVEELACAVDGRFPLEEA